VALQVALSLAILCNAMLMISERLSMAARPSGIADEQDVFYVHVSNQKVDGHEAQLAMQKQEEQTMLAVPGVEGVARTNSVPMSQSGWYNSLSQTGEPESATVTAAAFMSPGSLISVWKLKLTEGRDFLPEEVMEADSKAMNSLPGVGVITRALAKRLYPNDSSYVGKYF
jgi:putative ABC transport system permease protein